jgi:hypothetical protein
MTWEDFSSYASCKEFPLEHCLSFTYAGISCKEVFTMSSTTLYRWSGIALLIGSLVGIVGSILDTILYPSHDLTAQQVLSTPFAIDASLFLVWSVLLVMALPGNTRWCAGLRWLYVALARPVAWRSCLRYRSSNRLAVSGAVGSKVAPFRRDRANFRISTMDSNSSNAVRLGEHLARDCYSTCKGLLPLDRDTSHCRRGSVSRLSCSHPFHRSRQQLDLLCGVGMVWL